MDAVTRTVCRKAERMRDAFENKTETITFTVEEAIMNKLREKFEDVNVNECPWFDVQDRHGNAARYYREDAQPETEKRTAETAKNVSDSDLIYKKKAIDAIGDKPLAWTEGEYELGLQNQWQSDVDALKALPPAKKEITLEDVKAYCKPRCLQIVTPEMLMLPSQKEKEIKRLRELAARILGKYEEEKKKQLAAVRLASLRGSERERARELQARTERKIENLRKEIKGE